MKKTFFLLTIAYFGIFALAGCGSNNSNTSPDTKSVSESKFAVGDSVVAKYKTGSFAEGKIQSIEGQKAKIDWTNKKDLTEPDGVDLADVYLIPKPGDPTTLKAGDFALVNVSTYKDWFWDTGEIKSVSNGTIKIRQRNDFTLDLSSDKVIAVSQAEFAKIKEMFDKFDKERDFRKAAENVRPITPAEYSPKVGETVIGKAQFGWSAGKVKSISGNKATIIWDSKNNATFETTFNSIAPYPTAAVATLPSVNDFILIMSSSSDGMETWKYAQVTGVNGTDVMTKDESGNTATVKPGEFVLLK